jgi:hypothetical protein
MATAYERWLKRQNNDSNKEEENKTTKSAYERWEEKNKKKSLEETIGFDTFESDLNTVGKTVNDIYNGWQPKETMKTTRPTIEAMKGRIDAFQEYQKLFGGDKAIDITDLAKGYNSVLEDWDVLTEKYGNFKDADSYNVYTANSLKSIEEHESAIKTLDEKIANAKAKRDEFRKTYKAKVGNTSNAARSNRDGFDEWQSGIAKYEKEIGAYEEEKAQHQYFYDNKKALKEQEELNKKHGEMGKSKEGVAGFEKFLADEEATKKAAEEREKGTKWYVGAASSLNHDTTLPGSNLSAAYEFYSTHDGYKKPTDEWTEEEKNIFGAYYNPDSPWYDIDMAYEYATGVNDKYASKKYEKQKGNVISSATDNFGAGFGHTVGSILAAPMGLVDFMDNLAEYSARGTITQKDFLTPFDYSQTVTEGISTKLNEYGTLNEDIPVIGGKGWGDVYGLGTSIAQSVASGYTLGGTGTLISYFGQGAAAGVDDALSRGATEEQALLYGTILGAAEGVSEQIGTERLLGLGSANEVKNILTKGFSLKGGWEFLKLINKQGGSEGLEEGFSSTIGQIADNWILKEKSNFNSMVKQYMASGMSKSEATQKAWTESIESVAYDVLGGYISGEAHAVPHVGIALGLQNKKNKSTGNAIRENERVGDMMNIASMTPQESDTYKAYTEYAKRGINESNITDAQLGNLRSMAETDAIETLNSKDGLFKKGATNEQKEDAKTTLNRLSKMNTENKAAKVVKELPQNEVEENGEPALSEREVAIDTFADGMKKESDAKANLFRMVDDGKSNAGDYADSFNLVVSLAQNNFSQDYILENRGVLSTAQVESIYQSVVTNPKMAQQKRINTLVKEMGSNIEIKGTVDDSVIDYDNTGAEGKVNWNSLHPNVKSTIACVSGFAANVAGVDVQLVTNGRDYGFTGMYDRRGNTMLIDITALTEKSYADSKGRRDNTRFVVTTVAHELTHWMEEKAPELYAQYDKMVMDALTSGKLNEADVIARRQELLQIAENKRAKKEKRDARKVTEGEARREVVARASEEMLALSEEGKKYFDSLTESEQKQFGDKIRELFKTIKDWIKNVLSKVKSDAAEAVWLRALAQDLDAISKKWDEMLRESAKVNAAMKKAGINDKAIMESNVDTDTENADIDAEFEKITKDMSDAERYEILKNRKIRVATFNQKEYENVISKNPQLLDKKLNESNAKKLLKKIGSEFGVFDKYSNSDFEIEFEFGKNNMDESLQKQRGNYDIYAQMLSCFPEVITNAVGIEIHNRNDMGYKKDITLKNVYVLSSAFENETDIVPVKLEIKEFKDKPNRLYVAVSLEGIKKDRVKSMGVPNNRAHIRTSPVTISIHDLFSKINPIDVDFLKYIPNDFLTSKQKEKVSAKLDADYMNAIESGNSDSVQGMVNEAAKRAGYTIDAYHGSRNVFTFFSSEKRGSATNTETSKRWFFASDKTTAISYYPYGVIETLQGKEAADKLKNKGKLYHLFLRMNNPLEADVKDYDYAAHRENRDAMMEYSEQADKNGNDGIILYNALDNQLNTSARESTVYMFRDSSQAKSADPVTYDDNGNVIPLSKRFDASNEDIRYSDIDDDTQTAINQTMTMAQAKDMIQRAFVLNDIKAWYDDQYKDGDEWLAGEGAKEVAMYIENTYEVYGKYIGSKYQGIVDGDWFVEDIVDAYVNKTLTGKVKEKTQWMDLSQDVAVADKRFYSPKEIKNAKKKLEVAKQRITNSNRATVTKARAEILLYAHNKGAAETLGLTESELKKMLRQWGGYSASAREISMRFNNNVANSNRWVGIENCSWLKSAQVSEKELARLVNSIEGDSRGFERNYIARTMLALDTHIDWSEIKFVFTGVVDPNRRSVRGLYDNRTRTVTASYGSQNTVAHEMGHALDYKWARDLGLDDNAFLTDQYLRASQIKTEEQRLWYSHFKDFVSSITDKADLTSEYTMRDQEVFARFVASFVEWVDKTATGRVSYGYTVFKDRFTGSDYVSFVKILQEKAMLDSKAMATEKDVQYSDIDVDSEGEKLSTAQQRYFKHSKVRDKKGRLLRVYHGTKRGGFTVFSISDEIGYFFARHLRTSKTYADDSKTVFNPYDESGSFSGSGNYEVFLNIRNPFVIDGKGANWNSLEATGDIAGVRVVSKRWKDGEGIATIEVKRGKKTFKKTVTTADEFEGFLREYFGDMSKYLAMGMDGVVDENGKGKMEVTFPWDFDSMQRGDAKTTREIAKRSFNQGYDGVIFKNVKDSADGRKIKADDLYVAFDSNQIKSTANKNPTTNDDIRYSDIDEDTWNDLNSQLREKENQIRNASMELRKFDSKSATEKLYAVTRKKDVTEEELDNALKEYADWEKESGYGDAFKKHSTLKDEAGKLYGELREVEGRLLKKLKEQFSHFSEEDVKKYVSKAVRKYHTTSRLENASYLLTTGSMLDFSDGHGYRVKDHREISEILDLPDYAGYSDGMIAFMNMGNIRLQTYGIDISAMPNAKQISALRDVIFKIMREYDEFSVDFSKPDGYSAGSVTYGKGTSTSKIVADIKSFFETGVVPEEQSNIRDFLYSDIDADGNELSKEQIEYFKDSKVRDANGNLKVMWHGTSSKFTVFDIEKAGSNWGGDSRLGKGFYFAYTKEDAFEWSKSTNAVKAYLNLVNPLDYTKPVPENIAKEIDKYVERKLDDYDENTFFISREQYKENLQRIKDMYLKDASLFVDLFKYDDNGNMTDGIREFLSSLGYDGIIAKDEVVAFYPEQIKETTNKNPTNDTDIRYSDIDDDVDVYEVLGENKRLQKENKKLQEDFERLVERLKLERQVTGGTTFNRNQLDAVAGHIRNLANSDYSKKELVEQLNDVYTYIITAEELAWENDLYPRFLGIAKNVLEESRLKKVEENDYFKTVLKDIRSQRISLSDVQKQELESAYGTSWNKVVIGKLNVSNDATMDLDSQWKVWSETYPGLFDAETTEGDQIIKLLEMYDDLKDGSEVYADLNNEDMIRWLADEIYNQYWNVSTIKTTTDKYEKQIKMLNWEHRKAMRELRDAHNERLEKQKLADDIYYKGIISKIRSQKDEEIQRVRKLGKERMDKYRENAKRKTLMQSILSTTSSLNKKFETNSKDSHIPEKLKPVVVNLIDAIDFSSIRFLNKNEPTKRDIALEKKFSKAKSMADKNISLKDAIWEASRMFTEANNIFSNLSVANDLSLATLDLDLVDDIVGTDENPGLLKAIDVLEKKYGDNGFVLENMGIDDLNVLNAMVKSINHWANQIDKTLAIKHKEGITNLGMHTIDDNDALGEYKERGEVVEGVKKLLSWSNLLPINAFGRMGAAARKVFETLQDAQDKLVFNQDKVEVFTSELFKGKEKDIKKWREDVRTFDLDMPNGKKKTVRMPVSYMMTLYCVAKQEDAKRHLLGMDQNGNFMEGGGFTIKGFKDKGGITKDRKNTLLTMELISKITGELSEDQKHIADELQRFMNEKGSAWGDSVSMTLYGIKKFGVKDYFPISVTPTTIKKLNTDNKNTTHFFSILNYGFTKSRNPNAKQSIEIGDIFDVFTNHMTMMAIYNAYALPVYDMVRWYNFHTKTIDGEEIGVINSLQNAFGEEATSYIEKLITDLNGQHESSRLGIISRIFKNTKIAMVGNSLSVAALQPMAYPKAALVISPKYLMKSLLYIKDFGAKKGIKKAKEHTGIALWKSKGNFDVDISRNMSSRIKHDETLKDKLIEWSLKGAEKGDELTWGMLWNACEFEVRDKRKDLKVGDPEYFEAVSKRLREIIYKTQVVDSPLTRSDFMRSPDGMAKSLTMFASEVTVAYNIVNEAFVEARLDVRKNGKKGSMKRNGGKIARAMTVYTMTSALSQILTTAMQAFRDDDDEEKEFEDYLKMYLTNFALDWAIIGKIPYVKESLNYAQGYTSSRTESVWMDSAFKAAKYWGKAFSGDDEGAARKAIENSLKAISYLTGLAGYNQYRDLMATLDSLGIISKEEFEEWLDEIFG